MRQLLSGVPYTSHRRPQVVASGGSRPCRFHARARRVASSSPSPTEASVSMGMPTHVSARRFAPPSPACSTMAPAMSLASVASRFSASVGARSVTGAPTSTGQRRIRDPRDPRHSTSCKSTPGQRACGPSGDGLHATLRPLGTSARNGCTASSMSTSAGVGAAPGWTRKRSTASSISAWSQHLSEGA